GPAARTRRSVADRCRGRLPVVVEPLAGLSPEIASLDALLELRGRPVLRILGRSVGLEPCVVPDVEPGQIAQPERAPREVQAEFDGFLALPERRHALLQQV